MSRFHLRNSPSIEFRIISPVDGAILGSRDGRRTSQGLEIIVEGECPAGLHGQLLVNGTKARRSGSLFRARILLENDETEIRASTNDGCISTQKIRVHWRKDALPVFRLAIDDNIFFLRDLAQRRPADIFDSFYLKGLREIHRRTGMKVVLNLFFTTPEEDFNLSEFPEIYRGQFDDNADWLKLAFHAWKEFPDRPYQSREGAERLGRDYDAVASEILRFAGERAYSPTTVTHWAMVHPEFWQELWKRGTRILSGFFVTNTGSNYQGGDATLSWDLEGYGYDVNYCMYEPRSAWLSRHELLKDFKTGLVFSKVDLCCNLTPVSKILPALTTAKDNPATSEVMDVLTHEQYFWPFYKHYLPDHFERCMTAMRFCSEQGYRPAFFHEELVPAIFSPE